ncbi:MAG: DUF302 domain-containing protein [Pseudomonadota bacterium]
MKRTAHRFAAAAFAASLVVGCAASANTRDHEKKDSEEAYAMEDEQGLRAKTRASNKDFDTTLSDLKAAIETRGLKVFAVVDHAAGAASVGAELRPSTLIIFGNPNVGSPIMQAAPQMGIVLPLKAHVYEDAEGAVFVAVTDIEAEIAALGGDTGDLPTRAARVAGALGAIAGEAAE